MERSQISAQPKSSLNIYGKVWHYLSSYTGLSWLWLFGLTACVVWGINEIVLKLPPYQILALGLSALLLSGFLFKQKNVRAWLSWLAISLIGLSLLLLTWARLWQMLGALTSSVVNVTGQWLSQSLTLQSVTDLQTQFYASHLTFINLFKRLGNWLGGLGQGGVSDPLMVQLGWGMVIWLAISFLSWSVWKRNHALLAIMPLGALLTVSVYFSREGYGYIYAFLLFTLLLQASRQALSREGRWQKNKFDYPDELAIDLNMAVIPLSILVVGLAFLLPSFSISKITQSFYDTFNINSAQINRAARSFGLNSQPDLSSIGLQGLPRSHLLGGNPNLGKQFVMSVQTGQIPPMPEEAIAEISIPRHYWQAVIYSDYTSKGWKFSSEEAVPLNPLEPLASSPGVGEKIVQTVSRGPGANQLLHTSGVPLVTDKPVEASYNPQNDLVAATMADTLYTAESWLLNDDPTLLRQAGTDYPPAIKTAYLSLPPSVPDRVRNLAFELTANQPTPYDKAVAIESYLRTFPYNLDVPTVPYGADVADYFLFNLQEGYCDYYATSMVVLARSVGLPARFVVGYATGNYNAETAEYRVTEAEAHSWPQIYFPDVGWINFEPTAGRPEINRATLQDQNSLADLADVTTEEVAPPPITDTPFVLHPFWWVLLIAGSLLILQQLNRYPLRRLPPAEKLAYIYQRYQKLVQRTGFSPLTGFTPYETSAHFLAYMAHKGEVLSFYRLQKPVIADITQLTNDFVRLQYAPPGKNWPDDKLWEAKWYRIRKALWLSIISLWLAQKFSGLFSKATPPNSPTSSPNVTGTMGQSSQ